MQVAQIAQFLHLFERLQLRHLTAQLPNSGPISCCNCAWAPWAMVRNFFSPSTVHCTATGMRSGPSTNMPTSTMMMI